MRIVLLLVFIFSFLNASEKIFHDGIIDKTLTADRALQSGSSGNLESSSTTSTELGYISGVTSAVQTQLDAKLGGSGTDNLVPLWNGTDALDASTITDVELEYLDGVTSAIQTQLNAKQSDVITTEGDLIIGNSSNIAARLPIGTASYVLTSNGTTATWAASTGGGLGADAETVMSLNDFTANSGFETGDTTNWTNSGATFSVQDTTVGDGSYSASWDAAADGNTLTSDAFTIPNKLKNNNVVFCLMYKGGDANIRFVVNDGTNDFVNETLSTQTDWKLHCTNTVMPSVASVTLRLEADADAAVIYADNFAFALAELVNISNISNGGSWRGSIINATWATTSGSLVFPAGVAGLTATEYFNDNIGTVSFVSDGTGYRPGVEFTPETTGTYEACISISVRSATTSVTQNVALYFAGIYTNGINFSNSGYDWDFMSVCDIVQLTTLDAVDIQFRMATSSSTANAQNMHISIKKLPSSQQAINPSTQMVASGVKIAADAGHSFSTTSATYEVADDADVISTDKEHYGTATITADESNFGFKMPYLKANTRYKVFARMYFQNSYASSDTTCSWIIYDGTNEIAEISSISNSGMPFEGNTYTEGTITYPSMQNNLEFTIYSKRIGGGGDCRARIMDAQAEIGIIPLTEGINNPHILNNVVSSSSDGVRVSSADLNCDAGSAITAQDGSWVSSIGNISSGVCAVTLTSGTFDSTPNCSCSKQGATLDEDARADATTTTNVNLYGITPSTGAALSSFDCELICVGGK